jgi:hypothetical protein
MSSNSAGVCGSCAAHVVLMIDILFMPLGLPYTLLHFSFDDSFDVITTYFDLFFPTALSFSLFFFFDSRPLLSYI